VTGRPREQALAELEALQRMAPGEASVAFQMGKLFKRLNNRTVRVGRRCAASGRDGACWQHLRCVNHF
jgi:hypothetical protein